MDSVIIAAGLGSRMRSLAESKPLAKVCGIALIEMAVHQLARAGVTRVVVVTGYRGDELEAALLDIAKRSGLQIDAVRVADWNVPNGHSVVVGSEKVEGNYFLVMADHILSSEIFKSLASAGIPDCGVALAVDRCIDNPLIDPGDATYVRINELDQITEIGKGIARADAVDCGAFLASPELADAITSSIKDGKAGSLSDGMQWLADRGRAIALDIGQEWWMDVDDPEAHAIAERELPNHLPHLLSPL